MIINQTNCNELRDIFCDAIYDVFKDAETFIDFIEDEKYSSNYDCYLDESGENYIINRETGEYINWYKTNHIGRCITVSTFHTDICSNDNIQKWIKQFLIDFIL